MISVVIATYNGEKYIIRQLESIRTQTKPVDEVIICDDCSADSTVSLIEEFISKNRLSGWTVHRNEENLGYSLNFFGGLNKAQGEYIFTADQDDMWYKDKVEVLTEYLDRHPKCMAISSRFDIINENDEKTPNPGINFASEINDGSITEVTVKSQIGSNNIRGCAMCIRKELLKSVKFFKLESLLSHDWLLNIIACLTGENVIINKLLFGYRFHRDNVSLSSIARKSLIGDFQKRITGLEESLEAYNYLLEQKDTYINMSKENETELIRQIKFEKRRLKYLKSRNFFTFMALGFSIPRYGKLYGTFKSGIRIWLGDMAYANHKITSKLKK